MRYVQYTHLLYQCNSGIQHYIRCLFDCPVSVQKYNPKQPPSKVPDTSLSLCVVSVHAPMSPATSDQCCLSFLMGYDTRRGYGIKMLYFAMNPMQCIMQYTTKKRDRQMLGRFVCHCQPQISDVGQTSAYIVCRMAHITSLCVNNLRQQIDRGVPHKCWILQSVCKHAEYFLPLTNPWCSNTKQRVTYSFTPFPHMATAYHDSPELPHEVDPPCCLSI